MRRLDGFSAFTVYNDVPRCYQHTLKVALLKWENPEDYNYKKLIDRFERGLEVFPIMKWKLGQVPFGLNHPYWIEDTEFNIQHHVRRIACPKPGDKATFCELVSELYAHPLDKSRPLWIIWIIEGLEGNQVALVTLFHHAYADGAGAGLLMQGLFNPDKYTLLRSRDFGINPEKNSTKLAIFLNWMLRRAKGQLKLFGNQAISNVLGPDKPMVIGSAKVASWLSIGQLFTGGGREYCCLDLRR